MDDWQPRARASFAALAEVVDDTLPLGEAALWIAAEEYPRLDVGAYLGRLDALADDVREAVDNAPHPSEAGAALVHLLHDVEGFHGNSDDYYDPRNSFLNDVMDRRLGIPITLSILYMEVGRRLDLPIQGIGLPGHFLLRVAGSESYLDPFTGKADVSPAECAARVEDQSGGRLKFEGSMLAPWRGRDILSRLLRNLREIYRHRRDLQRSLGALDRLVLLNPQAADFRRDRARVLGQMGQYKRALHDLDEIRRMQPGGRKSERFRTWRRSVQAMAARMN